MAYLPDTGPITLQSASKIEGWTSHNLISLASHCNIYAKNKPVNWNNYTGSLATDAYYTKGLKIPYSHYADYNELEAWSIDYLGTECSLLNFRGYDNSYTSSQGSNTYTSNWTTISISGGTFDAVEDGDIFNISFRLSSSSINNSRLLSPRDSFQDSILDLRGWYPGVLFNIDYSNFIKVNSSPIRYMNGVTFTVQIASYYCDSSGTTRHYLTEGPIEVVPIFVQTNLSQFSGGGDLTWVDGDTLFNTNIMMAGDAHASGDYYST